MRLTGLFAFILLYKRIIGGRKKREENVFPEHFLLSDRLVVSAAGGGVLRVAAASLRADLLGQQLAVRQFVVSKVQGRIRSGRERAGNLFSVVGRLVHLNAAA